MGIVDSHSLRHDNYEKEHIDLNEVVRRLNAMTCKIIELEAENAQLRLDAQNTKHKRRNKQ